VHRLVDHEKTLHGGDGSASRYTTKRSKGGKQVAVGDRRLLMTGLRSSSLLLDRMMRLLRLSFLFSSTHIWIKVFISFHVSFPRQQAVRAGRRKKTKKREEEKKKTDCEER